MDGLTKPLRGWVKSFNPATLSEAIKKAHVWQHHQHRPLEVTPTPNHHWFQETKIKISTEEASVGRSYQT